MSRDFKHEIKKAKEFEDRVIAKLNSIGLFAFPFGQGQLDEGARELLRECKDDGNKPSPVRWMPDIIAFRGNKAGSRVCVIDAKVCDGPRYSLEISAIHAIEAWGVHLRTRTFFVFSDWGVLTPRQVWDLGWRYQGDPRKTNGSGTPFWLVDRNHCVPFANIFPPSSRQDAA